MALNLIERLNALAHMSPDDIQKRLGAKIPDWRPLSTFTRTEYDDLLDLRVTMFNTHRNWYLGSTRDPDLRTVRKVRQWEYATFRLGGANNIWYVINDDMFVPFIMGFHNVEANIPPY